MRRPVGVAVVSLIFVLWVLELAVGFTTFGAWWHEQVPRFSSVEALGFYGDGQCYARIVDDLLPSVDLEAAIRKAFGLVCSDETYSAVSGRLTYPLLSTPFVWYMGVRGLLAVPSLSLLIACLVPVLILLHRGASLAATVVGVLGVTSVFAVQWSFATGADSVLMLTVSLALMFLPMPGSQKLSLPRALGLGTLVLLGNFTKQSWIIWLCIAVFPVLYLAGRHLPVPRSGPRIRTARGRFRERFMRLETAREERRWLTAAVVILCATALAVLVSRLYFGPENPPAIVAILSNPQAIYTLEGAATGPIEKVAPVVRSAPQWMFAWRIARYVIAETLLTIRLDPGLALLMLLATLSVWRFRRSPESYVFVGVAAAVLAMGMANGTIGPGRFVLPLLPVAMLQAGVLLNAGWQLRGSEAREGPSR